MILETQVRLSDDQQATVDRIHTVLNVKLERYYGKNSSTITRGIVEDAVALPPVNMGEITEEKPVSSDN